MICHSLVNKKQLEISVVLALHLKSSCLHFERVLVRASPDQGATGIETVA